MGNPVPPTSSFPGVAAIYNEFDELRGTASLVPSGRHVLSAAHIFYDGVGFTNRTWTVRFENPSASYPFTIWTGNANNDLALHPSYTQQGGTRAGYDLAIVDLDTVLSRESYDIYRKSNEFTPGVATSGVIDFVGYGFTNSAINQCGDPSNAGIKRQGKNRFEGTADQVSTALGLAPFTPVGLQLAFDFDNGNSASSWRSWPGSQQGAGAPSGGVNSPSATWLAAYDQLVTRHRLYVNGQLNRTLTQSDWSRFADELTLLLGRIY